MAAVSAALLADTFTLVRDIETHTCSQLTPEGLCTDQVYQDYLSEFAVNRTQLEGSLLPIFQNFVVNISDLAEFIAYGGIREIYQDPFSISINISSGVEAITDLSTQQSSPGPSNFTEGRQSWLEIELGAL